MEYQGIPSDYIDELKSRVNIVTLISQSVPLVKKGPLWWGCCPFHHEKTASFAVDERKNNFHCYGCHEGGDAISWVQKTESLEFYDAVKFLARGVMPPPPTSPTAQRDHKERDRLIKMMTTTARYYHENLMRNKQALDYLAGRGIGRDTIIRFGLGYSSGGRHIIDVLEQAEFTLKEMESCSVIGVGEKGPYDFLGGRLIVPIFDAFGNVIAFGGRIIEKKDGVAKYKNSRESQLFVKNRTLYGLNFVKKERLKREIKSIIIVEGYMDTIALAEAGFTNVVASMGTALTENQAAMLKRMVNKVYICYDGDSAGQSSTMRGLEILKRAGLEVRVVSLPDGLDPDEIIRQRGVEAYEECLRNALPLYEYKIMRAAEHHDLASADGRSAYAKECLLIIADLDAVEQDAYLTLISERTAISRDALAKGIRRNAQHQESAPAPTEAPAKPADKSSEKPQNLGILPLENAYIKASRTVLALMLIHPDYTRNWPVGTYYFHPIHRAICEYILQCMLDGATIAPSNLYHLPLDDAEREAVITCKLPDEKGKIDKLYADCVRVLEHEYVRQTAQAILEAINKESDPVRLEALLREYEAVVSVKHK